MEVLCVSLRMPATGTVCPRKKAAVVADKVSGRDDQLALPNQLAFQTKFAMLAANAIMLTLNNICSGLNFLSGCGQHCTTVAMPAIKTASTALRLTTAIKRNGRLTDMLPSIPGNFTFIRDVAAASASEARA